MEAEYTPEIAAETKLTPKLCTDIISDAVEKEGQKGWFEKATNQINKLVQAKAEKVLRRNAREHNLPETENPNYKPISQIIENGIQAYIEESNLPVHWSKVDNRVSTKGMMGNLVGKVTAEEANAISYNDSLNKYFSSPEEFVGKRAITIALSRINQNLNPNLVSSVIVTRLPAEASAALLQSIDRSVFTDDLTSTIDTFEKMKEKLSLLREKADGPLSSSIVLKEFLTERKGDLHKSLEDTALFLRWLSRPSSPETDRNEISKQFSHLILDEFSTSYTYDKLPDDKQFLKSPKGRIGGLIFKPRDENADINLEISRINQVGKPYHAFHVTSLLSNFTPDMVSAMVGMEYLRGGHLQGWNKAATDMRVVRDLPKVDALLHKYAEQPFVWKPVKESL